MEADSSYSKIYDRSIDPKTRELFWDEQASEIYWEKPYSKVLDSSNIPFYTWFADGTTNACYNCIDRHVESNKGDSIAIISENGYKLEPKILTYNEVFIQVKKLASFMVSEGIKKGDRVIIYLPMIVEGIISMLACARIGAIHSVVFGGFAANELENRVSDSNPKLIITASVGIEPRKKLAYYPIVQESIVNHIGVKILLIQRRDVQIEKNIDESNTKIYDEEMEKISDDVISEVVWVEGTHPLYILYTSGTTGSPKGVVRDTGGSIVATNYSCKINLDLQPGEVSFSTSDIGWVVGHTYIVYGPLLRGCSTMIFEGKPVGTPDCKVYWNLIEKYNVKCFYTSPTALRAIKREDHDASEMKSFKMPTLTGKSIT